MYLCCRFVVAAGVHMFSNMSLSIYKFLFINLLLYELLSFFGAKNSSQLLKQLSKKFWFKIVLKLVLVTCSSQDIDNVVLVYIFWFP